MSDFITCSTQSKFVISFVCRIWNHCHYFACIVNRMFKLKLLENFWAKCNAWAIERIVVIFNKINERNSGFLCVQNDSESVEFRKHRNFFTSSVETKDNVQSTEFSGAKKIFFGWPSCAYGRIENIVHTDRSIKKVSTSIVSFSFCSHNPHNYNWKPTRMRYRMRASCTYTNSGRSYTHQRYVNGCLQKSVTSPEHTIAGHRKCLWWIQSFGRLHETADRHSV